MSGSRWRWVGPVRPVSAWRHAGILIDLCARGCLSGTTTTTGILCGSGARAEKRQELSWASECTTDPRRHCQAGAASQAWQCHVPNQEPSPFLSCGFFFQRRWFWYIPCILFQAADYFNSDCFSHRDWKSNKTKTNCNQCYFALPRKKTLKYKMLLQIVLISSLRGVC